MEQYATRHTVSPQWPEKVADDMERRAVERLMGEVFSKYGYDHAVTYALEKKTAPSEFYYGENEKFITVTVIAVRKLKLQD